MLRNPYNIANACTALTNMIDRSEPSDGPMIRDILMAALNGIDNSIVGAMEATDRQRYDDVVGVYEMLQRGEFSKLGSPGKKEA